MNDHRLSQIETAWSIVRRAHGAQSVAARSAQEQLLDQYGSAIRRYLLAALRDQTAADDVYQDFAVRFVRGDFRNASSDRGRFRSFLKTTLFRMVADFYRSRKARPAVAISPDLSLADSDNEAQRREQEFAQVWRDEMLTRAWDALEEAESQSGKPWFSVMKLRVNNPQIGSKELAEQLATQLGKKVTPTNLRVLLHRARDKFSQLLVDAVADSLDSSNPADIEQELAELKLLVYCRPTLDKLRDG